MHFGKSDTGLTLKAGMCFTIELKINLGKREIKSLGDGWTVVTRDHKFLHNGNISF